VLFLSLSTAEHLTYFEFGAGWWVDRVLDGLFIVMTGQTEEKIPKPFNVDFIHIII
jgi:hypothetical protein